MTLWQAIESRAYKNLAELKTDELAFPVGFWYKLRFANHADSNTNLYLSFCGYPKEVQVAEVNEDKRIIASKTLGYYTNPNKKEVPSVQKHYLLHLAPGEHKTLFVGMTFHEEVLPSHLSEFVVRPFALLNQNLYTKLSGQFFYQGLMILLALVAFFAAAIFRSKSFVFFALLQFSFALYAAQVHGILPHVLPFVLHIEKHLLTQAFIASILLFFNYFQINYLESDKRLPAATKWLTAFTWMVTFVPFIMFGIGLSDYVAVQISNALVLIWLLAQMAVIIYLTRSGVRQARNLLVAVSLQAAFALFYLLSLLAVLPGNALADNSFQIGSFILSMFVFYGLFENIRRLNSEKAQVEALDKLRTDFFTNITHEFRTPLTLIMAPLEKLQQQLKIPENIALLKTGLRNTRKLQQLINQILELSKLDNDSVALKVGKFNFVQFVKRTVLSFESLANQKNVRLNFVSQQEEMELWFDDEKMEIILQNLLSNAFKFTNKGEVSVMLINHEQTVELIIKDTGSGIDPQQIDHIFDRFYQSAQRANRAAGGTGIGLALVQEYVKLHGATISVQSGLQKGTQFNITFRKGHQHFDNECIDHKQTNLSEERPKTVEAELHERSTKPAADVPAKGPRILIIEDNPEISELLAGIFDTEYQVQAEDNGREGIEKALNWLPDLIISDVMMPEQSGIEVLETLKNNLKTAHIPIILLTARAAQEEKIEGIERGADAYMAKPFKTQELLAVSRQLLQNRNKLKELIRNSPTLNFGKLSDGGAEYEFILKVNEVVEKHLSDSQFSVSQLAEVLGMSRVHLNRKLNAGTGLSANKYIQQYRLKRALTLLEEEHMNVSEVAFQTGFSSNAYFVKCFREFYGKTPGSIQKSA